MAMSCCRKRNYTKQFDWTCELNNDLYKCDLRAKENKSLGYMTRMKSFWDEIHPEYSFLTSKLLTDQVSRVVKNKVVMEIEYRNVENKSLRINRWDT